MKVVSAMTEDSTVCTHEGLVKRTASRLGARRETGEVSSEVG